MGIGPAIAVLELTSIARGITTLDVMIKKAPVSVLDAGVISPGKYLIVLHGEVASVEESYLAGLEHGAARVVDRLLLPQAHEGLVPAMSGAVTIRSVESIGIVEGYSAAATIHAGDAAAKAADVQILELRFAKHLGGKGFFTMTGAQEDIEAALDAARAELTLRGMFVACEQVNRPHEELLAEILPRGGSELTRRF